MTALTRDVPPRADVSDSHLLGSGDSRLIGFGKPTPVPNQQLPQEPQKPKRRVDGHLFSSKEAGKEKKDTQSILYLPNATDDELAVIFSNNPQWLWDHKPMWVVFHRPEWASLFHPQDMVTVFPMYMLLNKPEWMCHHHPKLMMAFNPDILKVHNPSWMIKHHPHLSSYLYPEIVLAQDPEILMDYRPELFPRKLSWWQIFVVPIMKHRFHKAKTQAIEVPNRYMTKKENVD